MATFTMDTLELVGKLKTVGVTQEQAEAFVRVVAEAQDGLVTKEHLDSKLEKELAPIKTDLAVLKWMMGMLLASVLSLVLKTFF